MVEAAGKTFGLADCKQHTTEKDCWLIIGGKVYNVTDFLDEHPGGFDIIISATGKSALDATEDFEEIGHSNSAREMLDKYEIGKFEGGSAAPAEKQVASTATPQTSQSSSLKSIMPLLPIIVIALAVLLGIQLLKKD
eukprot:jgi/Astpho2/2688/e_gw1.00050.210.1_t